MTFTLDRREARLGHGAMLFDPATALWKPGKVDGETVTACDAARWRQLESGAPDRVPLGVVGPREATAEQMEVAARLGSGLAGLGAIVLCGGRQGVMSAVCRGVEQSDGLSIGLLPDESWEAANPHVGVVLASGLGVARNAVIARAARALFAIAGGYGTMSEIAFALQFSRPVYGLAGAPRIEGVRQLEHVEEALDAAAMVLLGLAYPEDGPS